MIVSIIKAVLIILIVLSSPVYIIKKGLSNIRRYKSHDENNTILEELDKQEKADDIENCGLEKHIEKINYAYAKDEKGNYQHLNNYSLLDLYKRKDFLEKRIDSYETPFELGITAIISVIVAFMIGVQSETTKNAYLNMIVELVVLVVLGIFFIAVCTAKYSFRGKLGSYYYLTEHYEIKLLEECIEDRERKLCKPEGQSHNGTVNVSVSSK